MEKINNLYDLARLCCEQFKNDTNNRGDDSKYRDSLFVSIDLNDSLLFSETPEFLRNEDACQCLLIHRYEKRAVTNWYSWYTIQFIDDKGCVHTNELDDQYKLYINYNGCFRNQWLHLSVDGKSIFSCPWRNKEKLTVIWNLYNKCKATGSEREAQLLGELVMMDQTVLSLTDDLANADFSMKLLAKERDQYKSLLDEIKELVHNK